MKRRKILVSGLINIETTLRIERFPLEYNPVNYPFFGVQSTVSGVGFNVAKALKALGEKVEFLSLTGLDPSGDLVESELARDGIDGKYVLRRIGKTAQSVILYENGGRRQIHVDLKNLQETPYPEAVFGEALSGTKIAALCNINFSRAMLPKVKAAGIPVATDVHVLSDVRDSYNADFMAASDWLFLSNERCVGWESDLARQLLEVYSCRAVVVGMGGEGVLLAKRGEKPLVIEARAMRPIVNTIGAGDALFSAFLHGVANGLDEEASLRRAVVFAGWKIGEKGAADGFLSAEELEEKFSTAK
jgi:ribokinase